MALYALINGQKKKVVSLYGSVNGTSKKIKSLWGSEEGAAKRLFFSSDGESETTRIVKTNFHVNGRRTAANSGPATQLYFYPEDVKQVVISGTLTGSKTNTSVTSSYLSIVLRGYEVGATGMSVIKSIGSVYITSTSNTSQSIDCTVDVDSIDWATYDRTKPLIFTCSVPTTYFDMEFNLNYDFEIRTNELKIRQMVSGSANDSKSLYPCNFSILDLAEISKINMSGTVQTASNTNVLYVNKLDAAGAQTNLKTFKTTSTSALAINEDVASFDTTAFPGIVFRFSPGYSSSDKPSYKEDILYTLSL